MIKKKLISNKFIYYIYKWLKIIRNKKSSHHFGEFGEDIFINRFFKNINNGFYVDVGCYHPHKGSLTNLLYKRGWSGMNIDISKTSIDLFNLIRKKDINLNCAISNFIGETNFYENSLINQQNSLIKNNNNQSEKKISCFTLDKILEKHKINNLDYLNVDVEGNELNVIKSINFKKYKPLLISIESNDIILEDYLKDDTFNHLVDNEYVFINKIGVTNIFVHKTYKTKISELISI